MYPLAREPGEEYWRWVERSTLHAEARHVAVGGQLAVVAFLKRWIKFVVQLFGEASELTNVHQMMSGILEWRDQLFWEFLQAEGEAAPSVSGWRHPVEGTRVFQWERHLVLQYEPHWQAKIRAKPLSYTEQLIFTYRVCIAEGFPEEKVLQMYSTKDQDTLKRAFAGTSSNAQPARPTAEFLQRVKRRKLGKSMREPPPDEVPPLRFPITETNLRGLQLFGDNESLVGQLNLEQKFDSFGQRICDILALVTGLWQRDLVSFRSATEPFFRYVPRRFNAAADDQVNLALDLRRSCIHICPSWSLERLCEVLAIRGFSDGGVRDQVNFASNGVAACGWVIEIGFSHNLNSVVQWQQVMSGSILLKPGISSFEAELAGAEGLAHGLAHLLSTPGLSGPTEHWFSSFLACN